MEKINLTYSTKNIPIPAKHQYMKTLIQKTERFVKNIRWRTFFFLNPDAKAEIKETYGFNSIKSPPQIPDLKEFEDGMLKIIQSIKFNSTTNKFQKQLIHDVRKIKNSDKILVSADKTTNFYRLEQHDYEKLIKNNLCKEYSKTKEDSINETIKGDKIIAENLRISDRIDTTAKREAFITLKDHKPNFYNNPQCRLINPCKTEIGKISKRILDQINKDVLAKTKLNQWKNTSDVIQWFDDLPNKEKYNVISFDICNFYPSINEKLLSNALQWASTYTTITNQQRHIINHTKKSTLYHNGEPWSKKESTFDVTMGSFDGAETCELVGLYLLSQLSKTKANIGLYRDDGLAVTKSTPRETDQIKKQICKIFKNNGLNITIQANLKVVNFLDTTFDFKLGQYQPYMKPNNNPMYVNAKSNHPPAILKNIPDSVNKRLSQISSNAKLFNNAIEPYSKALQDSGYKFTLKYNDEKPKEENEKQTRKRKREITWFNPPYSTSVSTNVGAEFFKLLDKSFPKNHRLNKLLNRNTVKLSYSCLPNMKQIISAHNKKIIKNQTPTPNPPVEKPCNCRIKEKCPINNKCQTKNVIYQATVTPTNTNLPSETYIGLTENTFKTRFSEHQASFKNENKRHATSLSEHIWKLKDKHTDYNITWNILSTAQPYNPATKSCQLCLVEKFFIITNHHSSTLNKKSELISTCRHRRKHTLLHQ